MFRTYHDRKNENTHGNDLPEQAFGPGIIKVQCPCGSWRHPFTLIDVRHLPYVYQDWACDGCWTEWQRRGKPLDGRAGKLSRDEWDAHWRGLHVDDGHGALDPSITKSLDNKGA